MADIERNKRPTDEVLFRWDPRNHSMNFDTATVADDVLIKRRMSETKRVDQSHQFLDHLDEKEASELERMFKDSTTDGLSVDPEFLAKNRDKRADLLKNLKKFQLQSCKDWLGTNTHKTSLEKVDTLDRLSSVIINPEFPMKHEAVLYSMQLGKSEFDFYNALYMTKLRRMSNPEVLELIRQPVFVRNRMLLLTNLKRCNCPLNVVTKQQTQPRNFFQSRTGLVPTQPQTQQQQYPPQQGLGDGLFNRFMMQQGSIMSPSLFGTERNYSSLFGLDRSEQDKRYEQIEESEIVCPFHGGKDLPESLKNPKSTCGVVQEYNLFYKYEEVKLGTKTFHLLTLHELTSEDNVPKKIYQYRLPSKLLAMNHVHIRDFEYERYYSNNNLYNSGNYMSSNTNRENSKCLSSIYSGDALFLVTKTEFILALVNTRNEELAHKDRKLKLGVLLRDKNERYNIKEVMCHKETGRIFMLGSNSLLYEYQYQLGFRPKSVRDHKVFNYLNNGVEYLKHLLGDMVRNKKVYEINTNYTVNGTQEEERNTTRLDMPRDNIGEYWMTSNCMDTLESKLTKCKCYYPPLMWTEFHYSKATATNLFSRGPSVEGTLGPGLTTGSQLGTRKFCTCGFGCMLSKVDRNVKCLNPWNKTFMKMGDSIGLLDEERWLLALLNTTSGDLSVFHIHGYTTLEEYTKGVTTNERVFPYDLTVYNLKHGNMMSTLERLGYGRMSYGSKFVKMIKAPVDYVQGVDLIIVDNYGVKIFVGFANQSLTASTSLISSSLASNLGGDSMKISASGEKTTALTSKVGLAVKGYRVPVKHMGYYRGPFSIFRSKPNVTSFQLEDLFMTIEPLKKVQNGTLLRVIVSKNDSSSFFQNCAILPLSLNEEFYMFNENTTNYKTLEENQPVEYYHQFYLKLGEKEKIITVYETENEKVKREREMEMEIQLNLGDKLRDFEMKKPVENKEIRIVTTEKMYRFNKFNIDLILKSLLKYPKNTLSLIKPPPLMNSNPAVNPNVTASLMRETGLGPVGPVMGNYGGKVHMNSQNQSREEDPNNLFDVNQYLNSTNNGANYFMSTFEQNQNNTTTMNMLSQNHMARPTNYLTTQSLYAGTRMERSNAYLNYLNQKNEKKEEFFMDIFGEDLVELCENYNELVGYLLYYLSWLYGPENMFKHVFKYVTDLMKRNIKLHEEENMNYPWTLSLLTNYYNTSESEYGLSNMNSDLLYNYIFANNIDEYNVFMGSFGIPYKIFNYVVPGCYCVLDETFEKPVVSPWCKFVSFGQNANKIKQNRVTTNTSPLVDGLLLGVAELLEPMYYNRVFNLVPELYTNTVTNPASARGSADSKTSNYNFYNASSVETKYVMDDVYLNRYDNMNEFVVGTRVDMCLTMELAMGLEEASKTLEKLHSMEVIAQELVRSYQKCNLENVVQIMNTLAPNVVKMMLEPNTLQYEPYPTTTQTSHYYYDPQITTTNPLNYYTKGNNTEVVDHRKINSSMKANLETLIKERYVHDLRTLKELTTILQVAQEFLASAILLDNTTILGECHYEFDKNLHLIQLLPSKTPMRFFSPNDFNLNWRTEKRFLQPFKVKFTSESPKSKLVLTKSMVNLMAQSNLINLFLNKELFRLFRIVVWLTGGSLSNFRKHYYGHIFTHEEIGMMNNCNRIKYLQRQIETTDDMARAGYLQSLSKQLELK